MQCPSFREAISARLDGEPLGMTEAALDEHLAACPGCAAWAEQAAVVTRRARLAPALAVPDLTAEVLGALPRDLPGERAAARQLFVTGALRMGLLVVGVLQAALFLPTLASGTGAMGAPLHVAHETAAWNVGIAAAFLAVAAAPRLAAGALPFLGSFAALLTVVTAADLLDGQVPVARAVGHTLLLTGVVLVAVLAWRGRRRGHRRRRQGQVVARDRVAA